MVMCVVIVVLIVAAFMALSKKPWLLALAVGIGLLAGLIAFGVIPIGGSNAQ